MTSAPQAAQFRRAPALAFECLEAIGAQLETGQTERDESAAMQRWLTARGVTQWFRQPFAWFGERTAFEPHVRRWQAAATGRAVA